MAVKKITTLKDACTIAVLNAPHHYNMDILPMDIVDDLESKEHRRKQTLDNLCGFREDVWRIPRYQDHALPLSSQISRNYRCCIYTHEYLCLKKAEFNRHTLCIDSYTFDVKNLVRVETTLKCEDYDRPVYNVCKVFRWNTYKGFVTVGGDLLFVDMCDDENGMLHIDIYIPAWYDVLALQRNPFVDIPTQRWWTRTHQSMWDVRVRKNPYV